jgi:hypothetical protein
MENIFVIALMLLCIGGLSMEAQPQPGGKIPAAYFSWSVNARAFAGQIAGETTGGLL